MLEELITKGRRVYCLYRVSTLGQVEKDDIPMQKEACWEFVRQHPGWEIVKLIFQKYLCEGYGAQRLCRYLAEQGITNRKGRNIPTTSINRIIKNPIYTGVIRNGDSQSEVLPELQIIDAETYERAQQMMEKRVT